ncbi:MAG: hypothetical protein M1400_01775 [Patescibacteria group bacterium]|nr:hypothetical protein [Patescibacteria group bacterium]
MKFKNNLTKIYLTLGIWVVLVAAMFVYGFKIVESSNTEAQAKLSSLSGEMEALKAERDSFNNAKKDLDTLSQKDLQPDNFFSQDVTLVNEVKFFENLSNKLGVKMNLSGPSGTVKSAPLAKSASGVIIYVPYNISIAGTFDQVVEFAQVLEHLPFATQTLGFSMGSISGNQVNATFVGNFYLRR